MSDINVLGANVMSSSDAALEAMSWRMFLTEVGFDMRAPITIRSDNQSSIALTQQPGHHVRTKHIDIRIATYVNWSKVIQSYIDTENMIADMLTKPLTKQNHHNTLIC
jgi:hypothetical protein